MEDKVKAMEKEIKVYKGSLEREQRLQAELQALQRDLERCRAESESKTERSEHIISPVRVVGNFSPKQLKTQITFVFLFSDGPYTL